MFMKKAMIIMSVLALSSYAMADSASKFSADQGGGSGVKDLGGRDRTQGVDTVFDESMLFRPFPVKTGTVVTHATATGVSAVIFGVATECAAVQIKADESNLDDVFVGWTTVTTGNGWPVTPSETVVFAPPQSLDCADMEIIQGASCAGACVIYALPLTIE